MITSTALITGVILLGFIQKYTDVKLLPPVSSQTQLESEQLFCQPFWGPQSLFRSINSLIELKTLLDKNINQLIEINNVNGEKEVFYEQMKHVLCYNWINHTRSKLVAIIQSNINYGSTLTVYFDDILHAIEKNDKTKVTSILQLLENGAQHQKKKMTSVIQTIKQLNLAQIKKKLGEAVTENQKESSALTQKLKSKDQKTIKEKTAIQQQIIIAHRQAQKVNKLSFICEIFTDIAYVAEKNENKWKKMSEFYGVLKTYLKNRVTDEKSQIVIEKLKKFKKQYKEVYTENKLYFLKQQDDSLNTVEIPLTPKENLLPPEQPKKETIPLEQPKKETIPLEQPKKETISLEQPKKETVPPEQPKKETVPLEQSKKETVPPEQPKKETVPPEQPKKETVPPEQPKKEIVSEYEEMLLKYEDMLFKLHHAIIEYRNMLLDYKKIIKQ